MSHLEKLKLLEVKKNSLHSPQMEPTEQTKAPSVGFVGTVQGAYEKNNAPILGTNTTAKPFDQEWFEERAAIYEFDAGFTRQEAERLAYLEVMKNG